MLATGFVPWRICKLSTGLVVPEVIPLGSFTWGSQVSSNSQKNKQQSRRTNNGDAAGPPATDASALYKRQRLAASQHAKQTSFYHMKFTQPMPYTEENVEIYEYIQPTSVPDHVLGTPLASILLSYANWQDFQQEVVSADEWNLQGRFMCSHTTPKVSKTNGCRGLSVVIFSNDYT